MYTFNLFIIAILFSSNNIINYYRYRYNLYNYIYVSRNSLDAYYYSLFDKYHYENIIVLITTLYIIVDPFLAKLV